MKEKKFWKSEKVLFAGCDQIERIRILDHHKNFKIKKDAFENCISLRKVSFFGGIKVESGAFRNCPKLYDFALINYYEGTEVSIADDAVWMQTARYLCQQMADFHGKEALSPFSMKMVKMDGMKKSREWITGIM